LIYVLDKKDKERDKGGNIMKQHVTTSSVWVRIAKFLNKRIIKTTYLKSVIYFIIAIAVLLLFYFLLVARPV